MSVYSRPWCRTSPRGNAGISACITGIRSRSRVDPGIFERRHSCLLNPDSSPEKRKGWLPSPFSEDVRVSRWLLLLLATAQITEAEHSEAEQTKGRAAV